MFCGPGVTGNAQERGSPNTCETPLAKPSVGATVMFLLFKKMLQSLFLNLFSTTLIWPKILGDAIPVHYRYPLLICSQGLSLLKGSFLGPDLGVGGCLEAGKAGTTWRLGPFQALRWHRLPAGGSTEALSWLRMMLSYVMRKAGGDSLCEPQ